MFSVVKAGAGYVAITHSTDFTGAEQDLGQVVYAVESTGALRVLHRAPVEGAEVRHRAGAALLEPLPVPGDPDHLLVFHTRVMSPPRTGDACTGTTCVPPRWWGRHTRRAWPVPSGR
ncbi:MAG: hypothetical protein IPO89_13690 [Actinomycetales bacterium]|nr:hypothetical protein [Candidatus Lutibacillus vidarii]